MLLGNVMPVFAMSPAGVAATATEATTAVAAATPATSATGSGKGQITLDGPFGVQVNTYTGNLLYQRDEVLLPGCSLPLEFALTYNSHERLGDAAFGYHGWRSNYDIAYHYEFTDNGGYVHILWGDGGVTSFWMGRDGSLVAPPGVEDRLIRTGPGAYELRTPEGAVYYFDGGRHTNVTRIQQADGMALVFTYDESAYARLTSITDFYGRRLELAYDAQGYLSSVTDPNVTPARVFTYQRDAVGNLTAATDPLGQTTTYTYDSEHRLTRITDPQGAVLDIGYSGERVASLVTDTSARYFSYDTAQNRALVIDVVDGIAWRTAYMYDARGRVIGIENALGQSRALTWDDDDNPMQLTDERGNTSSFTYDERGNMLSATDPLGQVETYTYEPVYGHLASVTDARGAQTRYEYNLYGNVTRVIDALGQATTYTYDDCQCHLIAVTDPLSRTTRYGYDAWGNMSVITDALGHVTHSTYDADGNLRAFTNASGKTFTTTYNANGLPIGVTDPLGRAIALAYDGNGRVSSFTDALGRATAYKYDALGRLTTGINAWGGQMQYTYAGARGWNSVTNPNQHTLTLSRDGLGRPTALTDALGQTSQYQHDANGNLTRRVDANGQTTTFTYDALNRLTFVDYPGAADDTTFAYDAAGNLILARNAQVTQQYAYDLLGQPTHVTITLTSPAITRYVRYTYNPDGTRATMTDPDGGVTHYEYDANGKLTAIVNPFGERVVNTYDPDGRLTRRDLGNGAHTLYTYDDAGQLTGLTHQRAGGSLLTAYAYAYDDAGNLISATEIGVGVTAYQYDMLNRLIGVTYPDGRVEQYTYDLAGNRLTLTQDAAQTHYTYDAAEQLTGRQSSEGTFTYAHDANGNLTGVTGDGQTTTYTYEARNRLSDVTLPDGGSYHFTRYPNGDILSQTDPDGVTRIYLYDDLNLLLELDASGATVARYTSGATDEWLSLRRGANSYTYHTDRLGSVVGLSDGGGNLVGTYRYDAFGVTTAQSSVPNPLRYTGRVYLDAAGLYDYRFRAYDPALGRFLSRDPVNAATQPNLYPYVQNNPLRWVDPLGLLQEGRWVGGGVSGSFSAIVGGNGWHGIVVNTATGEKCEIVMSCAQVGTSAGVNGGATALAMSGPQEGSDLAGWSVNAQVSIGFVTPVGGGEVGGGADFMSGNAYAYGTGGVGFSAEVGPTLSACKTRVKWCQKPGKPKVVLEPPPEYLEAAKKRIESFENVGKNPPECMKEVYTMMGRRLVPDPNCNRRRPPARPPNRAGNDHKDDTLSVSSPQWPAVGATGLILDFGLPILDIENLKSEIENSDSTEPVYRRAPRIALLWNGFAEEAAAFLNALGEPYDVLGVDFSPVVASLYPVLLIPSGGLYGLEGSASFRARLEAYVAQGGVILVSAQQRGYEFSALPGGLGGYGWTEDQSCFSAAAYFPQYHQAISSFNYQYISGLVDGYFTTYPTNTVTLLTRDKNGYPAALLYPYGEGYVIATTLYADWGRSNYQYSQHDHRVWRDMLLWGTLLPDSGTFADFAPGSNVHVDVRLQNASGQAATSARLILLNPDKGIVEQRTVAAAVAPGETFTITFAATAGNALGIWTVDYLLLDAAGNALQDQAIGAAFVVSNPHPTLGATRVWDFWTTAASEDWVRGTLGEFTFHIRNRTDSARQVRVTAELSHRGIHYTEETTAPPHSEVALVHTMLMPQNMSGGESLNAYLYEWNGVQWGFIRSARYGLRGVSADAQVTLSPTQNTYWVGETVTLNTVVRNLQAAAWETTLKLRVVNSQQQIVYQTTLSQTLPAGGQVTPGFTFPTTDFPTLGQYTVQMEALREGQGVGYGQTYFALPAPQVTLRILEPASYHLGQNNTLAFVLQNTSGMTVTEGAFNLRLQSPTGATLWSGSDAFTLTAGQAVTFTHALPFTTALGIYTLGHETWMGEHLLSRDSHPIAAAYAVGVQTDKDRYAGGETMAVTVTVQNTGRFEEALSARLETPDAPFSQTQTTTPTVGQIVNLSYTIPLTTAIDGGVHPFTVTLTTNAGTSSAKTFPYIILPADLRLSLDDVAYAVGGALPVRLTNLGGGQTAYSGQILLRDSDGRLAAVGIASGLIGSGATALYPLALPSDLADGLYILKATYYAHSTGQRVGLTRIVAVDGLEALLVAATDEPVYHSGDPITATAWLTNTGDYAIVGGRLALKAISMLGVGPLAGVVQDDDAQRIPGARVTLDDATTAWTNLAGEFRFESVGVGQHTFQVERVGYLTYTGTHFVVGPQAPLTFTLTPRPVAELSGAVRVSGGVTIVVGADVRLVPSAPSPALGQSHRRTGADGTYVFTDLTPGDYTLTVTAPGFATYTATLTLNAGTNSHDVELTPYSAWRLPFAVPRLARLLFQNQKPTIHNPQSKVPGLASPVRIPLLTNVGGAIITDTTWTLAGSPYVLTSDTIITAGVTLTVEPGVIVKGNSNVELKVMGHLVAVGTAGQPITFTSATNTSGGQWSGLVFDGGTGHLRHVTVRYGGQDNTVQGNNTGSNIVARNIISGELRLEQSSLRNVYNYYTDFGLYVANSRVVVSDTLFASNGNATGDYAFFSTGGSVITLAGSAFQNNAGWAARVEADDAQQVSDCTFSGNGYNRVLVGSGTFVNGITLVPQSGLQAYEFENDMTVAAGRTLTIAPDTLTLWRSGVELKVLGHLTAVGTPAQPITFTSATNTSGGQWSGLVFDGGTGHLRHVTVRYGGQDNTVQGNNTGSNIVARNIISGELRLEQSSLRNVYNYYTDFGLYVANSRVVVSDTLFASNGNATGDYAFFSTGGSVITLAGSAFQNNAGWAARVEADDAQQVSDCTFSGNGYNRVLVGSGTFVNGITLVPQSGLQAYEFENDMTVAAGRTLTIAPDTLTLWRSGVELKVLGHLTAVGTPAQPITFTSATNTSGGQWSGLVFDGGTGHLRHVTVRYGGQDNTVQGNNTGSNIVARNITSGTLRLEQSSLRNVYNYL